MKECCLLLKFESDVWKFVFSVFKVFWKLMTCVTPKWNSCGLKGMARGGRSCSNHWFYSEPEGVSCKIYCSSDSHSASSQILAVQNPRFGSFLSEATALCVPCPLGKVISVGVRCFLWKCFPDSGSLVRFVLDLLCAGPLGGGKWPFTKLWAHLRWVAHSLCFLDYSISAIQSGIAWASEIN